MKNILADKENYLFTIIENEEGYSQFLTTKELCIYNVFIDYYKYQWENNEITKSVLKNKVNDEFFSKHFLNRSIFKEINKIFKFLNNDINYKAMYMQNSKVFAAVCLLLYKINRICNSSNEIKEDNLKYTDICINDVIKCLEFNFIDIFELKIYSYVERMKYNDCHLIEKIKQVVDDKYYESLLDIVNEKISLTKFNSHKKYIFELFKYYSYLYLIISVAKKRGSKLWN